MFIACYYYDHYTCIITPNNMKAGLLVPLRMKRGQASIQLSFFSQLSFTLSFLLCVSSSLLLTVTFIPFLVSQRQNLLPVVPMCKLLSRRQHTIFLSFTFNYSEIRQKLNLHVGTNLRGNVYQKLHISPEQICIEPIICPKSHCLKIRNF